MSDAPKPAPACPKCGHGAHLEYACPVPSHPRMGLPCICNFKPVAPAPSEAKCILTREEYEKAIMDQRAYHTLPPLMQKLLAHDAALRAEVERLTKENEIIRHDCLAADAERDERLDAAEAEVERLTVLLREVTK